MYATVFGTWRQNTTFRFALQRQRQPPTQSVVVVDGGGSLDFGIDFEIGSVGWVQRYNSLSFSSCPIIRSSNDWSH